MKQLFYLFFGLLFLSPHLAFSPIEESSTPQKEQVLKKKKKRAHKKNTVHLNKKKSLKFKKLFKKSKTKSSNGLVILSILFLLFCVIFLLVGIAAKWALWMALIFGFFSFAFTIAAWFALAPGDLSGAIAYMGLIVLAIFTGGAFILSLLLSTIFGRK